MTESSKNYIGAFFRTRDHVVWVLLLHVFVKGLIAVKFLLTARLLGPEQFGVVGIALASLAIVESIADTGINQAVIQRQHSVDKREAGAVWTLQCARGIFISLILLFASSSIAEVFGVTGAGSLIALSAMFPLLRNSVNPGYIVVQRNRDFRSYFLVETFVNFVDLILTIVLLNIGIGAASVLYGTMAADASRLLVSWYFLQIPLAPNLRWRAIQGLSFYGRWIWGASVLTVFLNQFDKVVVARLLGATNFGLYQASSKIAQLAISDLAGAVSQYLFPTLSRIHHQNPAAGFAYFKNALVKMAAICGVLSLLLAVSSKYLAGYILGPEWLPAIPILQIQCLSMWFSALIVVCVSYLRSIGNPQCVTQACLIQLVVLVLPAYWAIEYFGSVGMAWVVVVALSLSFIYMYWQAISFNRSALDA